MELADKFQKSIGEVEQWPAIHVDELLIFYRLKREMKEDAEFERELAKGR